MELRHYLVSGRVQGVSFRRFVETEARAIRLVGVVRNLADGRVEIFVEGSPELLAKLEAAIRRGPPHSRVADVVLRMLDKHESLPEDVKSQWQTGRFLVVGDA